MKMKSCGNEIDSGDEVGVPFSLKVLEYNPRQWWREDVANKEYILKHLSRHLQAAGLDFELGAITFDLRWIHAQALASRHLGLKNDFGILERAVQEKYTSGGTVDPLFWSTDTGAEIATYSALGEGSNRLALSMNGKTIASASPNGSKR